MPPHMNQMVTYSGQPTNGDFQKKSPDSWDA